MNFWDRVFDLLKSSVVTQGVITAIVVGTWAAIQLQGNAPSVQLNDATFIVVGFYFGGKAQQAINNAANTITKAMEEKRGSATE